MQNFNFMLWIVLMLMKSTADFFSMCMFKNDKCLVEEIFVTQHYRMALKYYFHVWTYCLSALLWTF